MATVEIPDVALERMVGRIPPVELAREVAEALEREDFELALVLTLTLSAQKRNLRPDLPTLLRAVVAADAVIRGEM